MIRQQSQSHWGLEWAVLFCVLSGMLIGFQHLGTTAVFGVVFLSSTIALYRPIVFLYLLVVSTLFASEIPVSFGISLNLILISGLGVVVLVQMAITGSWTLPESRYASVVFLFAVIGTLSLIKAFAFIDVATIGLGFAYLGQWVLYLLLPLFIVVQVKGDSKRIENLLSFTLVASSVMAVYLLALVVLDIRPNETTVSFDGLRPLVAFWNQGQLAVGMFTLLTSLVSLGLALKEPRRRVAGALFGLSVLCGFLTLTTLARSAMLGLAIGVVVIGLIEYRWKTFLGLALAVPLGVLFAPEWLVLRLTRSTFFWHEVPALGISIPIGTLWKRINGWVQLGRLFLNNPLLGIGFSLSQERAADLYGMRISPDNQYVALLVETGIAGFLAFLMWVRLVLWRLVKTYRQDINPINGVALGMIGAFAGFLVWGFFQEFYARWRVLGPLFIYFGLIYAGHERPARDGRD